LGRKHKLEGAQRIKEEGEEAIGSNFEEPRKIHEKLDLLIV